MRGGRPTGLLLVSLVAMCGTSCKVYFTEEMRGYVSSEALLNVQFYNKQKLLLSREMSSLERSVTRGHTIRIEAGKMIEEIVLAPRTYGKLVKQTPNSLGVSFEVGPPEDKDPYIEFGKGTMIVKRIPWGSFWAFFGLFTGVGTAANSTAGLIACMGAGTGVGLGASLGDAKTETLNVYLIRDGIKVTYLSKVYDVKTAPKGCALLVNKKQIDALVRERRKLPGRRLD